MVSRWFQILACGAGAVCQQALSWNAARGRSARLRPFPAKREHPLPLPYGRGSDGFSLACGYRADRCRAGLHSCFRAFARRRLPLMLIVLACVQPVRAELDAGGREQVLADALAAFDRATDLAAQHPSESAAAYREAASGFETLVADGVHNGYLYYNLGNTYLQLGDLGRAITNYRRAELLIGNDASLAANLRYARSLCRTQIETGGGAAALRTAFFWHYDTAYAARFWVAVAAYVLFWVVLLVRRWQPLPGLGFAAAALLVLWLSAGTSAGIESWQRANTISGVTVAEDIVVRKGNGEGYDPQFKEALQPGVEFKVIDDRKGWYKIELTNGDTGWLKQEQAEIV
jgi:tetratricopeptide (TPR) repeat protein